MAVPKSERSTPKAKFMQDAYNVRKKTLEVLRKFPKGYKFNLPARIAEMADKAYWYACAGNAVYMHKNMPYEDYMHRRGCFLKCYTTLRALTAETSFCYELLMEGNNFFEDARVRDKTFSSWTALCATAATSMKNIMDSDRKRYAEYAKTKPRSDELERVEKAVEAAQMETKKQLLESVRKILA